MLRWCYCAAVTTLNLHGLGLSGSQLGYISGLDTCISRAWFQGQAQGGADSHELFVQVLIHNCFVIVQSPYLSELVINSL